MIITIRQKWFFWGLLLGAMNPLKANSQPNSDTVQLVSANNGFAFRLLRQLGQQRPRANLFVSPYSISSVLQMLSSGARGQTREELQHTLGTGRLGIADVEAAYSGLNESISTAGSNAVLSLANALWYRQGAQLNPDFAALNTKSYQATLGALDFASPASAEVMNHWASEHTHGRIQSLVQPPLPADTAIVIANAIYFKGTWLDQFDPKQTTPRAFHSPNGNAKPLPMMQQTRSFSYQQGDGFQAVQLTYAGNHLQMQVLLPETNSSVETLVARLDSPAWQSAILPAFAESKGTLVLPRFQLRYRADLRSCLTALGLKSAWTQNADFSGISPSRLFLSKVEHQSFVEVNEQGTEAAAVTSGVMALASFRNQPPPFQMTVDRPFLFVISDRVTRSILFIGAVFDPAPAGD